MNQTIETIKTRRSIRRFTAKPVPKEDIDVLLDAAMHAPSACNQQPWHFVVIDDPGTLAALSTVHGGLTFAKDALCAILVCGEPQATQLEVFWREDCAAATMNILLAAHSLGLGAIWTGIDHTAHDIAARMRDMLGIPDAYVPFSVIPIGYPDEQRTIEDRFDPDKVHYAAKW